MFLLEIVAWLLLSVIIVGGHIYLTKRPHERPGLTILTGAMWGVTGGLLGTIIELREWDTAGFNWLALLLAGAATGAFLLLEWASGHQHPTGRIVRR